MEHHLLQPVLSENVQPHLRRQRRDRSPVVLPPSQPVNEDAHNIGHGSDLPHLKPTTAGTTQHNTVTQHKRREPVALPL